ncbi:hypothetical protein [Aeromicrobium endophyticum]|uniref:Copper chaperone PCu(A)C n=1 Tax=Aeromicrobium endophyticum TaxID=2292704 RepID=A0A371P1U1_9ACTN|nr:hypothetical protein [Aeromicrobium endophyticum]REK69913.1 hypothetical protein DX116_12030 [Aeromicrobium endophyticum]
MLTMMRRRTAAVLLGVSLVGGVAAGFAADAMTSDPPTREATPRASASPATKTGVEVKSPVLVANDDGGATLSATLVNHTDRALTINSAMGGMPDDDEAPVLLMFAGTPRATLPPGSSTTIGRAGEPFRIRFRDRVQVGSTLPITLDLAKARYRREADDVTFTATVVARGARHADVANNAPNRSISVRDGIIVKVPGQDKAYLDGWIDSSVDDMTDIRPTGDVGKRGDLEILHQTATGGPSGVSARAGVPVRLGYAPYKDDGQPGDRDYVRADEVEVGRTVQITFRFPSGDVVARFKVVQGKPDGTI